LRPQLRILQYNVRKSKDTVMATMLRDPKVLEYDILAIQEPWRNPFKETTHHPAKNEFHLCYPKEGEDGPARVCLFIHKRINHTRWQFKEHSRDHCTWILDCSQEDSHKQILAFNLPCLISRLPRLSMITC
jgi:hypothetical protein